MWPWLLAAVVAFALALLAASRRRHSADAVLGQRSMPDEKHQGAGQAAQAGKPAEAADDPASAAAGEQPADDEEADPAPLAPFNHRRHWAVLEGLEDAHRFLLDIFKELLREGSGAGALIRGEMCHMVDNRGHLMFSALLRRAEPLELLAMYPYSESPHIWPLLLRRVEESPDGLQARLLGSCRGAPVGLFDTLYMKNHDAYRLGDTYELQVSAVAYQLEPDELGEDFAPDFSGFGPLSRFSPDAEAAPDEVVFHSYIESVQEVSFWGVPLRVYTLPLCRPEPDEEPLRVEVYVHEAVAERPFAVGERVRGVLWLFAMWPAPEPMATAAPADREHVAVN